MKLVYHRGDSDYLLRDYVYLWNLLARVSDPPVTVISDHSPFADATKDWRRLSEKGRPTPVDAFGKGGKYLGTSLLLYDRERLEFFWHGREDVERVLEEAIVKGRNHFLQFLGPRNPRRRE